MMCPSIPFLLHVFFSERDFFSTLITTFFDVKLRCREKQTRERHARQFEVGALRNVFLSGYIIIFDAIKSEKWTNGAGF